MDKKDKRKDEEALTEEEQTKKEEASDAETTDPQEKERPPTPEETIIAQEAEIVSLNDKLLRNQAELQNFRRRLNEERVRDRIYANAELIRRLLVPLDNLDIALSNPEKGGEIKKHMKGLAMIRKEIVDILEDEGLEEIKALEQPFDPNKHQAVAKEKNDDLESGTVIEVYQKGYQFKERVIRPAMVKVTE